MNCRIVIADDDAMLRIGLKAMLPWTQYGYQIVGEAQDGREALELCRKYQPDILLTDMKMPETDGLEVLRTLASWPQKPAVIVLSGYDEFSLVREAMRLGALDYLLKLELSPSRLLQCLQTVQQKMSRGQPEEQGAPAAISRERVLRNLISHFYVTDAEMDEALQRAGVRFETDEAYCMLLHAGDWFRFEDADEGETHTLQYSMENIAMEIASGCMTAYCVSGKTGELYLFAGLKAQYADRPALIRRTAYRLRDILRQYLDINCVIAIGSGTADAAGLSRAAGQAAEAMRRRFCLPTDGVLWWQDVSLLQPVSHNAAITRCSSELYAGLNTLDWERTERAFDTLTETLAHAQLSHAGMLQAAAELQNGVCECLERYGRTARQALSHSYRDLREILTLNSASDCIAWIKSMQEDIALFFSLEEQNAANDVVRQAIDIMEKRFAQPFSLRELADELQISPGYLSVRLKKQTGMNFSEYLMQIRLRKAQRMLRTTDKRIVDIAAQAGYPDQFYFSRLFKRATGMTPSEYRKQGGDA